MRTAEISEKQVKSSIARRKRALRDRFELIDLVLLIILVIWALIIILPFFNVVAGSFSTQKEYMDSKFLIFPTKPTLMNYKTLFKDQRIWVGYRSTLQLVGIGVPISMFMTTSMAYALSKPAFPFKKFFMYAVMFTMLFHGGIVPMYMLMNQLNLTNTIWSVLLSGGMSTFNMIIMRSYFQTLPESLVESAKLDGAGEWRILFTIVLPLSMPIIATITLFYTVGWWNEWFSSMVFIRKSSFQPLQLVLRNMVLQSRADATMASAQASLAEETFTDGLKMAAVMVTMAPVMCFFPFLQKYFVKGVLIGAIKA